MALVTNYHKCSSLKGRKFILLQFWKSEALKSTCQQGCALSGSCRREFIASPFPASSFSRISPTSASVIVSPSQTLTCLPPSPHDYMGPICRMQVISLYLKVLNLIASAKFFLAIRMWTSLGPQCFIYHNLQH